jgi:predicted transglutaminase-like cysteine proteinase
MPMEMSEGLLNKLRQEGTLKTVTDYITETRFFQTLVTWALNYKYRSQRTNLHQWINSVGIVPEGLLPKLEKFKNIKDKDEMVRQVLTFVANNLTYYSDQVLWDVLDYWQTPYGTWTTKTGDCEDGAILIYTILNYLGIEDDRMWIVCGDVIGGGHAYVVYRAYKDEREYPMDWCYWFNQSVNMFTPYYSRAAYYYGEKEWFRFNKTGAYKARR